MRLIAALNAHMDTRVVQINQMLTNASLTGALILALVRGLRQCMSGPL